VNSYNNTLTGPWILIHTFHYTNRNPKSLRAVLSVVTDDLLIGERQGYRVIDHSKAMGDPAREFHLKVVLLYVQGDYPAQKIACGYMHAGLYPCHYCSGEASFEPGINRCVEKDFYRWLPQNDSQRDGREGQPASIRTAASVRMDGLENEGVVTAHYQKIFDRRGIVKDSTRETLRKRNIRGVKWFCVLSLLYMFDVVWDFVYDLMHGLNVFERAIIPSMKGVRPAPPKMLLLDKKVRGEDKRVFHEDEELKRRKKRNTDAKIMHNLAVKVSQITILLLYYLLLYYYYTITILVLYYFLTITILLLYCTITILLLYYYYTFTVLYYYYTITILLLSLSS
jgi:hypothetical protein